MKSVFIFIKYMYIKDDAKMAVEEEKKKQSHPAIPFLTLYTFYKQDIKYRDDMWRVFLFL